MNILKKIKKRYFKKRTTLLDQLSIHAQKSLEAVMQMNICVLKFCDGTLKHSDIELLDKLEDEGDEISYSLLTRIFQGATLPFTSQDWFELVELIDNLADFSERVGKLLMIYKMKTSKKLEEKLIRLTIKSIECAELVVEGVKLLNKDMTLARDKIIGVNLKRHEARLIEYELYSDIFKSEKLTYKELLTLKEIIYWITQISNASKKASIRITLMAVKYSF